MEDYPLFFSIPVPFLYLKTAIGILSSILIFPKITSFTKRVYDPTKMFLTALHNESHYMCSTNCKSNASISSEGMKVLLLLFFCFVFVAFFVCVFFFVFFVCFLFCFVLFCFFAYLGMVAILNF